MPPLGRRLVPRWPSAEGALVGYPVVLIDRVVTTALDPDVVLSRLRENSDPTFLGFGRRPFYGWLSRDRFVVRKMYRNPNPFVLELSGQISPLATGSEIRLVVRVDPLSVLLVLSALILTIWWWVATTQPLPFLVATALSALIWLFWFGPESVRVARELLGLLQAR